MITLWLCNGEEDFVIEKFSKNMDVMTADGHIFSLQALKGKTLAVLGKNKDALFAVFHGHRLAFKKEFALMIQGTITGKTKEPPVILGQPIGCNHNCGKCKGCCWRIEIYAEKDKVTMNTTVLSVLFGIAVIAAVYVVSKAIENVCNKHSAK